MRVPLTLAGSGADIEKPEIRMIRRTGTIYSEFTNKGRSSVQYRKGCKPIYCFRWVGEIVIHGRRYRFRSTNRANVEAWVEDMVNKSKSL